MQLRTYIAGLIFTAFVFMVTACNDHGESPDISYPLAVQPVAIEEQGTVKLYSKSGEIKDEAIISKFIANGANFTPDYFNQQLSIDDAQIITFTTDSTAKFGESDVLYQTNVTKDSAYFRLAIPPLTNPNYMLRYQWHTGLAVKGNYRSFRMPFIVYKLVQHRGEDDTKTSAVIAESTMNELNSNFLATLQDRDTFAYRQSYVRYKE